MISKGAAVSGVAAAVFGFGRHIAYARNMLEIYPAAVFSADIIPALIAIAAGAVGGMIGYDPLTGAVLRRLLIRAVQRRKEVLIAQFE